MSQPVSDSTNYVRYNYPSGNISSEGFIRENQPDGYWKTYYENGILKSEGNRKDFLLDGIWKFYDIEGNLTLEIEYKKNEKNGIRTTYFKEEIITEAFANDIKQGYTKHFYPDGSIKKELFFMDGLEEGIAREFDTLGVVITLYQYKRGFLISREIINRTNPQGNKNGTWITFFDNGKIRLEEQYRNGILNGFVKEWDETGNLLYIHKYNNGELQADADEVKQYDIRYDYYENGKVKIIGSYRNNIPDGVRREYNESGKIIKGYIFRNGIMQAEGIIDEKGLKQGPFKEYYENGSLLGEGLYRDSKKIGAWKFYYQDGKTEQVGTFDNRGQQIGTWKWFHLNGLIWIEEEYINGQREGIYTEYDTIGKVIVQGEYFDGEETGFWFWEIGDTRDEGNFVEGQYDGQWITIDTETGKTIFEGKYLDGSPNGKHTYYWENGQKRLEGYYVMGIKEGDWVHYTEEGINYLKINYKTGIEQRYDNVLIEPQISD